jgi:carbonic anhydrase/acetyltransferase-like protein (isoleucine patch superfamily)
LIAGFRGKTPRIADSAFVSKAAYVVGDVELGENSGIWPGTVVRGDFGPIKIGNNTQVEDNCMLHCKESLTIGDNVIIGHCVVMHGTKVGHNTLVGSNATVLDDAEIGNFCIIGAGCLIGAGRKIPDHSLVVGVPGRVIGPANKNNWTKSSRPARLRRRMNEYKEQGL